MAENNNKLLYIVISDWTEEDIKSAPKFQSLIRGMLDECNRIDPKQLPFCTNVIILDMARFFLMTVTEDDLREKGYIELLEHKSKSKNLFYIDEFWTHWMFPEYKPEIIGTEDNGKFYSYEEKRDEKIWVYIYPDGAVSCLIDRKSFDVKKLEDWIKDLHTLRLITPFNVKFTDDVIQIIEENIKSLPEKTQKLYDDFINNKTFKF